MQLHQECTLGVLGCCHQWWLDPLDQEFRTELVEIKHHPCDESAPRIVTVSRKIAQVPGRDSSPAVAPPPQWHGSGDRHEQFVWKNPDVVEEETRKTICDQIKKNIQAEQRHAEVALNRHS